MNLPKNLDPTPDQIRRMTEEIREKWSPQECDRRSGVKPTPWMPPLLTSNDLPGVNWDFEVTSGPG